MASPIQRTISRVIAFDRDCSAAIACLPQKSLRFVSNEKGEMGSNYLNPRAGFRE